MHEKALKKYHQNIQYQFLDRDIKMENGFTILDYDEYFYLINTITKINEDKGKTTKSNKWNLIDLINFYMYLKMRIIYFYNSNILSSNIFFYKYGFSTFFYSTIYIVMAI